MEWVFARVGSNLELITCDNPLIFKPSDLSNKNCVLILPMGPSHFFLATYSENLPRLESNPRKMVSFINQEIVRNADTRIYARSEHSINNEFILNNWHVAT